MDKYEHALIRLEEEKGPGNVTESDIHMLAKSFLWPSIVTFNAE